MRRALITTAFLVMPVVLAAQGTGPEFSLGVGGGTIRINCDNCEEATWSGTGASQLNAMFPIDKRVLIGLGLTFTQSGDASNETNLRALAAELRWAPNLHKGFTMHAGYGLAITRSQLTDSSGVQYVNDLTGMMMTVGVGWRFPVSRRLALEPQLRTWIVPWGTVRPANGPEFQNILSTNYALLVTLSWR